MIIAVVRILIRGSSLIAKPCWIVLLMTVGKKIVRSNRVKHTAHGEGNREKQAAHGEGDREKHTAHGKGSPCAIQRSDREKQAAHKPLIEPPKDITPKSNHPKMKKESAMRVDVTRQPGKPGFFHMERSTKSDDRMFISSPYTAEMTRDEAISLIEALIMKAEEIWPEVTE